MILIKPIFTGFNVHFNFAVCDNKGNYAYDVFQEKVLFENITKETKLVIELDDEYMGWMLNVRSSYTIPETRTIDKKILRPVIALRRDI